MSQEEVRKVRMARPFQLPQGADVPGCQGPAIFRGKEAIGAIGHRPSVSKVVLAAHQKAVFRQKAGGLVIAADMLRDPVDQLNDPPGRPLRGPLQSVDGAAVPGGGVVEVRGADHGKQPLSGADSVRRRVRLPSLYHRRRPVTRGIFTGDPPEGRGSGRRGTGPRPEYPPAGG